MKAIPSLLKATVFMALASCATPTGQTSAPGCSSPLSAQVFQDVNAYRLQRGAGSLRRNAGLDRLALNHCEYLRKNRGTFNLYGKNVSHDGAEGRSLVAMQRFNMLSTSEIVASTLSTGSDAGTARALVILWQNSRDHESSMRDKSWTDTGVATVVDADGRVFATQLFGTASHSQLTTRNRFSGF